MDGEKQIQDNEFDIREKEKEIKRLLMELDSQKSKNEKLLEDNIRLYSDNDKCKNHINTTTDQNSRVNKYYNTIILFILIIHN